MVSRQHARAIANQHRAGHSVSDATGQVRSVKLWDEIDGRKPDVCGYGEDFWSDHWSLGRVPGEKKVGVPVQSRPRGSPCDGRGRLRGVGERRGLTV